MAAFCDPQRAGEMAGILQKKTAVLTEHCIGQDERLDQVAQTGREVRSCCFCGDLTVGMVYADAQ
jgi:hypothetical protein